MTRKELENKIQQLQSENRSLKAKCSKFDSVVQHVRRINKDLSESPELTDDQRIALEWIVSNDNINDIR